MGKLVLCPMKEHQFQSNLHLFGEIGKEDGIHNVPQNLSDGRPQFPQAASSPRKGTNGRRNHSTPSSFEPIGRRKG